MIKSYNSTYSLEYYDIGEVYSFYIRKQDNRVEVAAEDIVNKFAKKLNNVDLSGTPSGTIGKFSYLFRTYGVVVDKIEGNGKGSYDKIKFLFNCVNDMGEMVYGIVDYVVDYGKGVETDECDSIEIASPLYIGKESGRSGSKPDSKKIPDPTHEKGGGKTVPTLEEGEGKTVPTLEEEQPGKEKKNGKGKTVPTVDETNGRVTAE